METLRTVVFGCADDWSASLTWMQSGRPIELSVASRFLSLTALSGRLPADDIRELLGHLFPAIGAVVEASAVTLPDGRQALEVLESFSQGDESKKGYQLIFPAPIRQGVAPSFQRLCFYAPDKQFDAVIADVRTACHSFRQT